MSPHETHRDRPSVGEAWRGNAWKIAILAVVLSYPLGSFIGRIVAYVGLKQQHHPTRVGQLHMGRNGNTVTAVILILGWVLAVVAGMQSMRVEDLAQRRLGRSAFVLVLVATVLFIIGFGLARLVKGMPAA